LSWGTLGGRIKDGLSTMISPFRTTVSPRFTVDSDKRMYGTFVSEKVISTCTLDRMISVFLNAFSQMSWMSIGLSPVEENALSRLRFCTLDITVRFAGQQASFSESINLGTSPQLKAK